MQDYLENRVSSTKGTMLRQVHAFLTSLSLLYLCLSLFLSLLVSLSLSLHLNVFFPPLQDLSKLGRDITQCVIIDNSPQSYIFHPDNAVSILRAIMYATHTHQSFEFVLVHAAGT